MAGSLAMSGVYKSSADGRRPFSVLTNLSLTVGYGEIVAVVGPQGAGKTTLLEVAAGIQLPDEGDVRLGDLQLADLSDRARERLLGSQIAWTDRKEPRLPWNVRDYAALPLALGRGRREARRSASKALERVGAGDCAERRWGELVAWEQVLVGFARAITGRPRLIVADDLLDGLSRRQTQEAGDLLRDRDCQIVCVNGLVGHVWCCSS
jgi:putative ABC transport system ATP-binding protein